MSAATNPLIVPLSALAEVNPPRLTASLQARDEVSFIPMGDVSESGRWTGHQLREYAAVRNGFTCFADGDVLFAKITPCMENGKGCLVTGLAHSIGFGSTEFHVLRARPEADAGYVYQWSIYSALRQSARNSMTGSAGQQRVPTDFFDTFCVPKFSKPEQTKIAEILATVDRAIEQTEALIAKQQRLKTGLMQDLLTRGIDEHGNLRSEQTHKFKDSPLGRIPVEWEVSTLDAISDFVTSGSRGWAQYYSAEGALFLRIGNLSRQHVNMRFEDVIRVQPPVTSEGKRTSVEAGDILISITADLGIIGVIPENFGEAYVNQHIALIRPQKALTNPRFAAWFFASHHGQQQFEKLNESGAKSALNLPSIRHLLLPVFDIREQDKIAEALDACMHKWDQFRLRHRKLRALKTALMQDLLTGRKRVTELLKKPEVRR
jgi:type I restriction enzyme S subunit